MLRYPLTIFLSAFLLFQVQPLIGKMILPWFGGSPAVWTACMLFFQVLLLGGYSYAHLLTSRLSGKALGAIHGGLLLVSLVFLPVTPAASWKPTGGELPVLRILGLLTFTIGLPYFLLSTTGPLLQEGFRRETGRTPYRLYALSNIGSLLALLTYPFLFEPQLTLRTQVLSWSAGYLVFVGLCLWSAVAFFRAWGPAAVETHAASEPAAPRPAAGQIVLWLALAACGSVMLLATTNQLCQEVTSVPLLWVLPLSLYLLTFIICFDHERWYHRNTFSILLVVALGLTCAALFYGKVISIWGHLAIYSATLFVCCMVCHGELVKSKPAPEHATLFYLMVAAGGALGGVLVAIVAPLVLRGFWEYQMGLVGTVILAFVASTAQSETKTTLPKSALVVGGSLVMVLAVAVGLLLARRGSATQGTLESTRNFYGALRVNQKENPRSDNGPTRELIHGTIQHGFQFLDAEKKRWPTTYYGRASGVGLALDHHPRRAAAKPEDQTLRIGVVGLGCGTLAAYGQPGDYLRFYEINPEVIRLSDKYFSYRKDTPAEVDVVLGDARLVLERELDEGHPQHFDVLAIDAFSSDSIPMHLLTKESIELFLAHLKPDGLLCIHISNRYLDLAGVVMGIAEELNWPCALVTNPGDDVAGVNTSTGVNTSSWAILTQNWRFLNDPQVSPALDPCWPRQGQPVLWTDDYGSLWQVVAPIRAGRQRHASD